MKVQLTPRWKFVCDRCGKETYLNEGDNISDLHEVVFGEFHPLRTTKDSKSGDVCGDCFKDFLELANNFFNEVNKESEDKYLTPSDVRKMSPREVKENYDLIMESMKRW